MIFLLSYNVKAVSNYVYNPSPSDNATDEDYSSDVTTCVDINMPDVDCSADMYFYTNSSGSWAEYSNHTGITSKGSYCGNISVVCGTTYYWNVSTLFNCSGVLTWENHTYSFTTIDCPVSHVTPSNNSINNCPCCLAICVKMSNLTGDTIKFAFQSNYTGNWDALEADRIVPANNTYCICVPEFVWFNYTYYWRVIYHDGNGVNYSDIYHFTTALDVDDCPCGSDAYVGDMVSHDFSLGLIGVFGMIGLLGFIIIKKTRIVKKKKEEEE